MRNSKIDAMKQGVVITLLLFAVSLAATGITGLIPKGDIKPDNPKKTEEIVLSEEVFSVLPTEEAVTVFSGFSEPLTGRVSSAYGYRKDPFSGQIKYHKGVDVSVREGTDVKAVSDGTVTASKYDSVGGNYVIVDHGNGVESYYGHLQTRTVAVGDSVVQGQIIGLSGKTGKVTGAHLHFQLTYRERTVDPQQYLDLES